MGFCMTVTNTSIVVAQCPYIPVSNNIRHLYHNIYRVLPTDLDEVNSSLCAPYNRRGYLCSDCKEGHGLAAYRYYGLMCVKCSHPTLMLGAYIILLLSHPTFSFFLFFLFKTNIHSGHLTSFIFFSHTIVTTMFFFPHLSILPMNLFGYWPLQIIMSFYAVWSLDFVQFLIPPFCLHAKGNKCIVALWKPFKKLLKVEVKDLSSIIYTFGSFVLLSYGKNLFVSFSLFSNIS
ncbi:hypothetical protein GBAR_LOCUS24670 [Geodia barretti]|uniref:Uncharacterized protein n=1 Tax=Geodia barretti TaxID=519541 RepID=A0AA35TAW1_GEOBA|nr:hypothetical protein GBAR_LOCUS24670 [Geodia barretti]